MSIPERPKIYHIVHWDRLPSIISSGALLCDKKMQDHPGWGTNIGMDSIKLRRLEKELTSHRELHVGECVPFYFCPRSVMLYVISKKNNPNLKYSGGQENIVHLRTDLKNAVSWADSQNKRWAFTNSNAGSGFFDDFKSLADLDKLDWEAIQAINWKNRRDGKQAEFLVEDHIPLNLVESIGVFTSKIHSKVSIVLESTPHKPKVEIKRDWYY